MDLLVLSVPEKDIFARVTVDGNDFVDFVDLLPLTGMITLISLIFCRFKKISEINVIKKINGQKSTVNPLPPFFGRKECPGHNAANLLALRHVDGLHFDCTGFLQGII